MVTIKAAHLSSLFFWGKYTMKRFFCYFLALSLLAVSVCAANELGPKEIILKSTVDPSENPRLAFFPHAQHQKEYYCSTCHHITDKNGKKIPFDQGMKVEKCESCHNKAAAYRGMPEKLTPLKNVAHLRCKGCHRKLKKEGKSTGPITCKGCHREKINK